MSTPDAYAAAGPDDGRAVRLVLAFVGLVALWQVPLPGVDHAVVAALSGLPWPYAGGMGVVGVAFLPFVVARALRAWALQVEGASPTLVGVGSVLAYLGATAVHGLQQISVLESMGYGGMVAVHEPGSTFRWLALVTFLGAAALLWRIADVLGESELGHGASLVVAAWGLPRALGALVEAGTASAGVFVPGPALASYTPAACVLLVAAGLAGKAPGRWDLPVGAGQHLRGPVDLVALPVLVALAVPRVGWVAAPLIAAGLVRLVARRGASHHPSARAAILGALFACLAVGAWLTGFAVAGGVERAFTPGPFAGENDAVARLVSDGGRAEVDAERIAARLTAMRIDGDVAVDGEALVVTLRGVSSAEEVLTQALRPGQLAFHWEAYEPGPGVITLQDCSRGDCQDFLAVEEPVIRSADVAEAAVAWDLHGQAYVALAFGEDGAARFGRETAANVGRRFALVVDGTVVSAPIVREAIPGGRASIEMGRALDPLADATALVASLESVLSGPWRVVSIEATR